MSASKKDIVVRAPSLGQNAASRSILLMMTMLPVSAGVERPKVALLILAVLCLGPQFYFGFVGSGILAPLGWSLGMSMFAVGTGWRAPQKSIPTSVLIGTCYAAAANVPIYLIGRWLGDPTSASVAFTAIASVSGLLTFGLLTLLRRIWPQHPANDRAPALRKNWCFATSQGRLQEASSPDG